MTHPESTPTLRALLGPGRPEIGCDECFDELDRYVDLEIAGDGAETRVPGMRAHLEGCPACREDYESLRDLVRTAAHPAGRRAS